MEFISNGEFSRPGFSLLISSHLMFGLVILLNKQHTYILEELNHLKSDLKFSYSDLTKKHRQTPKKVKQINQSLITLKDNLPELMDESSISAILESRMNEDAAAAVSYSAWGGRHLLNETDDSLYQSNSLIPIDVDMQMVTFNDGNENDIPREFANIDSNVHMDFSTLDIFKPDYSEKRALNAKSKRVKIYFFLFDGLNLF
jgi:hypothetical protein